MFTMQIQFTIIKDNSATMDIIICTKVRVFTKIHKCTSNMSVMWLIYCISEYMFMRLFYVVSEGSK